MNERTRRMLLAAKSLLATVATPLTPSSDAFTIARSVLTIQDAVELALAAICVEDGEDHKIAEKVPFNDLVQRILSRHGDATTKDDDRNDLFALNHARVRFKHHGDLLDPATTYRFLERALMAINRIIRSAIGVSIEEIDGASAIQDDNIAGWYRRSERAIADGDFRGSLCLTAEGLAATFWEYVNMSITTGRPNSEDALILSGRGIDPATFLAMQRLLPDANPISDDEPKFKLREYGHEINWTEQNARFCLETAIGITMRLQHAPTVPEARRFYDEFEDVLTITADSTEAIRWPPSGSYPRADWPEPVQYPRGTVFGGEVRGFWEFQKHEPDRTPMELDEAEWVCLTGHNPTGTRPMLTLFGEVEELWFRASDVEIGYRRSQRAYERLEMLRRLAEQKVEGAS